MKESRRLFCWKAQKAVMYLLQDGFLDYCILFLYFLIDYSLHYI